MKLFIAIFIFLSTIILIFLLPIQLLVWQEGVLVKNVQSTHESTLSNNLATKYSLEVIGYLHNKTELPSHFSENEVAHMESVKDLFVFSKWLLFVALTILCINYLFFKYLGNVDFLLKILRLGTYISLALLFCFGILTLMDFSASFLYFHHIFFPQGNFLFPENTLLIQIFTERFFKETSGILWLMSFIFSGIIVVISLPRFHTKSI